MKCPWCTFEGSPRALHKHFGESHPEAVRFEERGASHFYAVECPICGQAYEHAVKPRLRDPDFVQDFQMEIRLVAFDMLVNHLIVEHEPVEKEEAG